MSEEPGQVAYEALLAHTGRTHPWGWNSKAARAQWAAVEAAVRAAALEEAARIADHMEDCCAEMDDRHGAATAESVASAIRAARAALTPSRPSPPSDEAASSPQG
jgi:ribulose kinase